MQRVCPVSCPGVQRAGYLLSTEDDRRVRRARDAVRAATGLIAVVALASDSIRLSDLQLAMEAATGAFPGWAELLFWIGYGVAGVYAAVMIVVVIARAGRNPGAARDVLLAAAAAFGIAVLAMRLQEGVWPRLLPEFGAEVPEPLFPIVRVAIVTATVLAASPHVNRSLRRLGAAMILLVVLAGFGLDFGVPTDALASVGIGMLAAGGVLLVFGSPAGLPDVAVVAGALGQLGVRVHDLEPAAEQSWGVRSLTGRDDDGVLVEVKAYGRDAADTQIAAKAWRAFWYRDTGPALAVSRMQSVEHEALMALFSQRAGAAVTEPLTAGMAGDDVAILAVQRPGRPLASLDPDELRDEALAGVWRDVARLHAADIAHGSLTAESVLMTDAGHLLDDFAAASLGAGARRHLDVVTLLFSLTSALGSERAVASAREGLGDDRLDAALPYFQLPALSRAARRAVPKPKAVMKELREGVAGALGVEPPEPVKLRRVSVRSLVMAGLMLFAANALITQLGGVDYSSVWDVLKDSSWLALLVALPVAHLTFPPDAVGMIAAVGYPLPLRPVVVLQLAARFIGLAVPSAAGRIAMNTAFLVKFGVRPAVAVVQGAIDSVSGFMVEASILLIALLLSDQSFSLGGDVDWQRILLIGVVAVVIGVGVLLAVRSLRQRVVPLVKEALGAVVGVVADPRRGLTLLGGNFVARLVLGVTLWIVLRAVGVDDVSIAVALAVTVATNLLAGLVPVPGGIGVAEAVMTSWLVLVGVPQPEAFAATIVFRLWTFYLPAIEGFFALRWLESRDYL